MKITDQVTSLEISKKLKELGIKQEGLFMWIKTFPFDPNATSEDPICIFRVMPFSPILVEKQYLDDKSPTIAFTVAELGEILSASKHYILPQFLEEFQCWYSPWSNQGAATEADARGEMLIYLIETHRLKDERPTDEQDVA